MVSPLNLQALSAFDAEFDTSYEDAAAQQRGAFLRAFPLSSLNAITIDQYVIGKRQPTFCTFVEPLTSLWANILGATSFKFGIYYGRTRSKTPPCVIGLWKVNLVTPKTKHLRLSKHLS